MFWSATLSSPLKVKFTPVLPVCRSCWSRLSLPRSSKRTPRRWRSGTRPTPSPWWTTSATTSPATCRRTARSRRPIRNWRPWRSCSPALILTAEGSAGCGVFFKFLSWMGHMRKTYVSVCLWVLFYLQYIVQNIYFQRMSGCYGSIFRESCLCCFFE